MSHEIEGKRFYAIGAPAWHDVVKPYVVAPRTAQEAIELAGQNWTANDRDLFMAPSGERVPTHKALVRSEDEKFLSVVSVDYVPTQPLQLAALGEQLTEAGLGSFETGGVLYEGRRIWQLIKLNKQLGIFQGDEFLAYILCASSFDGTLAEIYRPTMVRTVCRNTMEPVINGFASENQGERADAGGVRLLHRGDLDEKRRVALAIFESSYLKLEAWQNRLRAMAGSSMTPEKWESFLDSLLPLPLRPAKWKDEHEEARYETLLERQHEARDKVRFLAHQGQGSEFARDTVYAAYNGATEFIGKHMNPGSVDRFNLVMFGEGQKLTRLAGRAAISIT